VSLGSYWRLIRHNRNFRLLWMAQIVSELGDWFYSITIFSFLLELTGSAQMVAFAFLMQVLPQVFMAPTAGVLNDRLSRKQLMIFADLARAGIVLSMMFVRSRGSLWLLFVLLFLETLCFALFEPGRNAVVPNIAAPEDIPAANALGATTWSVNFAIGAALGGLVNVSLGRTAVFVLNSISFLASAFLIQRMRFAEPHAENLAPLQAKDLVDFSPVADGMRYVWRDPKLLATIFVKGGIGLMGSNWVILTLLGQNVFPVRLGGLTREQAGTLGMSLLMATRGFGAIFGAVLGGLYAGTDTLRLRRTILAGFLMGAVGYVALGSAGSLAMALLAVGVAHMGASTAWTSSTTLIYGLTEDRFLGRVSSAEFAFGMLTLAGSSFTAGRFSDMGVSVQKLAVVTGAVMVVPALVWVGARRVWR
jgi:MFS family permease